MNGLNAQLAAPTAQLLRGAETEFSGLRARRETIARKLDGTGLKDSFGRGLLLAELRSLDEQLTNVQIEQLGYRAALLRAQMPEDKEAIAPLQSAFDQAHQRYLEATREREEAGIALHQAQTKVSCAEANINFYERTIQDLKRELASKGKPERSAGEIASELNDLEKRLGWLRTISSGLPADS